MNLWNLCAYTISIIHFQGPSWSWSYGSCIYNYLFNQYLSPITLWVRIPLRRGVLDTTLCDKVCQWLATGLWFSPGTPVSSINKTDRHDILLKIVLNTLTLTLTKLQSSLHIMKFKRTWNLFIMTKFQNNQK
jgi:hypothetical protein